MHPNSNQACLTFFEPTKEICITIPTSEDVKQLFAEFHELSEYRSLEHIEYFHKGLYPLSYDTSIPVLGYPFVLRFLP